jgi:nicotinate-nucleotide adenylyltransferase
MVRLAVSGHPRFDVSDVELRRAGPSYTVDTLAALAAGGDELHLVIGSETFLDLLSWRSPRRVAELARLVVVPRWGSAFDPEAAAALKVLREIGASAFVTPDAGTIPARAVLLVHALSLPISSSELRVRTRDGRSLAYRLPDPLIAYIRDHGLYREPAP